MSKNTTTWVNYALVFFLFIGDYYLFNSLTFLTSNLPALRAGGLDGKQALPIKTFTRLNNMNKTEERKEKLYELIFTHGERVKKFFNMPASTDPIGLCKQLRRLENKARRVQDIHALGHYEESAREEAKIVSKLKDVLMPTATIEEFLKIGIFLNTDQRGYALKIPDEVVKGHKFYRDWGDFGIIAPDLREDLD